MIKMETFSFSKKAKCKFVWVVDVKDLEVSTMARCLNELGVNCGRITLYLFIHQQKSDKSYE